MDPLTQGVLGATLSRSFAKKAHNKLACVLGFISGMSADLDILIRSDNDPLLFLEYHRQFTHSLIFIPFGGLICSLILYLLIAKRKAISLTQCWFYCTLGFATHAVLDACTSYGTQLLWPFDSQRIAWDIISIIDPIYTLPLMALLLCSFFKNNKKLAVIALIWALIYPSLGLLQRQRVIQAARETTEQQDVLRITAKPSFANLLLWKVIVETDKQFDVYAIRAGRKLVFYPGQKIKKIKLTKDFSWLNPDSQQAKDIDRFKFFSSGYIAIDPRDTNLIIDIRYSMLPNTVDALWGIRLNPSADEQQHVEYYTNREVNKSDRKTFIQMLINSPEL